jgi:hypothetical protein
MNLKHPPGPPMTLGNIRWKAATLVTETLEIDIP